MKQETVDKTNYLRLRGQKKPLSQIIAVGGGKGGVGKSFMSSSIALFLSQMGYKTKIIDLDLGAANIHTYLGLPTPKVGIDNYIKNPHMKLHQVATKTAFPNLELISCATDDPNVLEYSEFDRSRLMSGIYHMDADFIILDLSAGTHYTTLDFFLMASHPLVVMTPEPVSVENAYRFIKSSFFRRIKRFEFQLNLQDEINRIMAQKEELGVRSPGDLLYYLEKNEPERGVELQKLMQKFRIGLVLNQGRSQRDLELAPSIKSVCMKYFGISCDLLGQVEHDNAVWQSLRRRKHLLVDCPQSRLYTQLMAISRTFTKSQTKKAVV